MALTVTLKAAILLFLSLITSAAAAAPAIGEHSVDFVRSSCLETTYPDLCFQSLSSYASAVHRSPRQLAHAALTVSATRARAASALVARLSAAAGSVVGPTRTPEASELRDCFETMADSVDQLRKSVQEMGRMGRARSPGFRWHLSNVQTWVSAALTDQSTCMDGLAADGRSSRVRDATRKRVVEVAHVTSNALALINRIGPKP